MKKPFTHIVIALLDVIAFLHLLRLTFRWEAVIGGWVVPFWPSAVFVVVGFGLAFMLWKENR